LGASSGAQTIALLYLWFEHEFAFGAGIVMPGRADSEAAFVSRVTDIVKTLNWVHGLRLAAIEAGPLYDCSAQCVARRATDDRINQRLYI